MDLSTHEAEATLDLWEHQLERLRNEGSVRTITRELRMAQSVPAVRIRAFKNGEGSRGHGEIIIGSSIHAVCINGAHSRYFGHIQNFLHIEGNMKIVGYQDRKTPER